MKSKKQIKWEIKNGARQKRKGKIQYVVLSTEMKILTILL
jgi:hypothetical protein